MSRVRGNSRTAALAAVAVVALAGCGDDSDEAVREDIAAIDLTPDQVASVSFTAAGKTTRFEGRDGTFLAAPGASSESATILSAESDRIFPLNSYRILDESLPDPVDPSAPVYGLVAATATQGSRAAECGAGCSMEVVSTSGDRWRLDVGGRTFNGAGFYAAVDGDPRVYLLISQSVADIITLATGRSFTFPASAQIRELDSKLETLGAQAEGKVTDPTRDYDPYLRQVLAAAQDAAAARDGKSGNALVQAATSTRDQVGSAENLQAATGGGAAPPGQAQAPAPAPAPAQLSGAGG